MNFIEINAKRVHSNLAFRYFMSYFKSQDYLHFRYTINQPIDIIVADIIKQICDEKIFIFSAYVWNITYIKRIAYILKGAYPESLIIIGGPEVTFYDAEWLDKSPFDILVKGEGEQFYTNLSQLDSQERIDFLQNNQTVITPDVIELDQLGIGYEVDKLGDEYIIYYESSRGCPYNCSYCISSTTKGVRYKTLDLVKRELDIFIAANIPVVKFIDRTFNAPIYRAIEIMSYLIEHDNGVTTFHFELSPNLIDDVLIQYVKRARPSLFQFEVGLQSAKKDTLVAVGRTFDALDWSNVKALVDTGAHVHLDLITGLPYETFDDFKRSFDAVIALKPSHFQVGVLKLLQGSTLRAVAGKYKYVFDIDPPYTFYQNHVITAIEQTKLLALEEGTERIYNDGAFTYFIKFLYANHIDVFDYLIAVGEKCLKEKALGYKLGKIGIAEIACACLDDALQDIALQIIAADFFINNINLIGKLKSYRTPVFDNLAEAIFTHQAAIKSDVGFQSRKDVVKALKVMQIGVDLTTFRPIDEPAFLFKFKEKPVIYQYRQQQIFQI